MFDLFVVVVLQRKYITDNMIPFLTSRSRAKYFHFHLILSKCKMLYLYLYIIIIFDYCLIISVFTGLITSSCHHTTCLGPKSVRNNIEKLQAPLNIVDFA